MHTLRVCLAVNLLLASSGLAIRKLEVFQPAQTQNEKILRIITNPVIWRKNFPSVLAALKDWKQTGEAKVAVYKDQAVGSRKFSLAGADALTEASELHLLMSQGRSELRAEFRARLDTAFSSPLTTLSPVAQPARDDAAANVVLNPKTAAPAEMLSPTLTLAMLREQAGEPESITTQVIDTGDERRPTILTLYHYAGDAIVFAVSDMSATPDLIDRAFLDTKKISEAIFSGPQ